MREVLGEREVLTITHRVLAGVVAYDDSGVFLSVVAYDGSEVFRRRLPTDGSGVST